MKDFLQLMMDYCGITGSVGFLIVYIGCAVSFVLADDDFNRAGEHDCLFMCLRILGGILILAGVCALQVMMFAISLWLLVPVDAVAVIFCVAAFIDKWRWHHRKWK